ncbi:hypothetical protein MGMO_52c00380 [Methyloglobulus morosus KoM1]|uniref:Uncharacterized protein n=1 Tax=Methyloglobulus morosus KoM1 TaxID=1116472 RepID=V5C7H7_9GAMM|nr:hypothetical protein [Methyloglobulus morosus]ESS72683.1 hypothetical protein MGMO_52c00380 [Methyloglobulus morosus KoM1]
MTEIENIYEQLFMLVMRGNVNGKASTIIDTFSGWLISGFAAASTLFVSQYKSIQENISICGIQWFIYLFIAALILAIFQKFIAVIVASHSMGSSVGYELGKEFKKNNVVLNREFIFNETEKGMLPFVRWCASDILTAARNGDFVSSSRNFTRLCQYQGLLTLIQAIVTLFAIRIIATTFHA